VNICDFGFRICTACRIIDYHEYLVEHHLPGAPERMHHLHGLTWVGFSDFNDRNVVCNTRKGQVHIHQFGYHGKTDGCKEYSFRSFADPCIFHRWNSHDGCRINSIFPVGDAGHMKYGIVIGKGIKTGMVAERSLPDKLFRRVDSPFDNKIDIVGNI